MKAPKTANICINILASMSHLELLQYDIQKSSFEHMDSEEFLFDPSTREFLEDDEQFKTVIKRLFDRNKIPYRTPTSLVFPSFFTRQYSIPDDLLGEDLTTILVSEAERFYVFKKVDPDIGYCAIKNNQILYTAYPKLTLDIIRNAFIDLKIPLVSIDCNYTATIRGLVAMGVVQQEIANQLKWGVLIISDYNIFMSIVEGSLIEKTLEAPVSLQNTEEDALLSEVKADFQEFFGFEVLSRIVIVNNSLKIYSPTLAEKLGFQGITDFFDQNDATLTSRGAEDAAFPCTLEAVGGALVRAFAEVPAMEMADPNAMDNLVDEGRKNLIAYCLIGLGAIIFLIQMGIGSLLDYFTQNENAKTAVLQGDINTALNNLSIVPEIKRKLYIKQAVYQNYRISNLVIKIYKSLPADAWLKESVIKSATDLKSIEVNINGSTLTPDPLNAFVKELNNELPTSPITPTVTPKQQDDQRYFDYTLISSPSAQRSAGSP